MTLIVAIGPRTRALAVRLERAGPARGAAAGRAGRPAGSAGPAPARPAPGGCCTDIEAA